MNRCRLRPARYGAAWLAIAAAMTLSQGGCGDTRDRGSDGTASAAGGYRFTEDWFTHNIPVWQEVLGPMSGRPGLSYLEIGVFEGRSAIWMLENVLTHPSARLTGVDLFPAGDLLERYQANLARSGHARKATTIRGRSQIVLRSLAPESFDIIYVDGSHTADDVLADVVLSWGLLRDGGLLILDDYAWSGYEKERPDRRPVPADLRPQLAIDAFLTANRHALVVLHRGYQVIVGKRTNPCPVAVRYHCTPLGEYNYLWRARALLSRANGQPVELTEQELDLIERLLVSLEIGQTEPSPPPALRDDPAFRRLSERLRLAPPVPAAAR